MVKKFDGYTLFTDAARGQGMAHLLLVENIGISIGVSKNGKADTVYPGVTSQMIIDYLSREDPALVADFIRTRGNIDSNLIYTLYSWSTFQRSFEEYKQQQK